MVILPDLKLPKIEGLEVLRRPRADARTKFIPVVAPATSKEGQDLINGDTLVAPVLFGNQGASFYLSRRCANGGMLAFVERTSAEMKGMAWV